MGIQVSDALASAIKGECKAAANVIAEADAMAEWLRVNLKGVESVEMLIDRYQGARNYYALIREKRHEAE